MKRRKPLLLAVAIPIVAGSMSLSRWAHSEPHACADRNEVSSHIEPDELYSIRTHASTISSEAWSSLDDATQRIAKRWQARLGDKFSSIVRTPFVICGDVEQGELVTWFESTIAPAAAAMARDYFQVLPDRPVTILLLQDETSYRRCAKDQFRQDHVSIYGYYKPSRRAVVINLAAGGGTIVHELTHALIDFDFPDVPIWFNEGLASLHEQCDLVMTDVGPVIAPLPNWRLPILQEAIVDERLPTIRELMRTNDVHGADEAMQYAHARYFCMFVHEQGVLQDFYRAFRAGCTDDKSGTDGTAGVGGETGSATLAQFFPETDLDELDDQFRRWAMTKQVN